MIPMEVSAGVAASASTRGPSLSMPPPPPSSSSSSSSAARKEWRAVSEHRNAGDEVLVFLFVGNWKMWEKWSVSFGVLNVV